MSAHAESWLDATFKPPPLRSRIEPGLYYALSRRPVMQEERFGRKAILLPMSIRRGQVPAPERDLPDLAVWAEVAVLPFWIPFPGRGVMPKANSRLGMLLETMYAGTGNVRPHRETYRNLEAKLWWVEVGDKIKKTAGIVIHERTESVVRDVLRRIA